MGHVGAGYYSQVTRRENAPLIAAGAGGAVCAMLSRRKPTHKRGEFDPRELDFGGGAFTLTQGDAGCAPAGFQREFR
jgi:hypothetical protein